MRTLVTRLIVPEDKIQSIKKMMEMERTCYNKISPILYEQFAKDKKVFPVKILHDKVYRKLRNEHPEIPSQIVIKSEQDCRAAYLTIRSNKHRINKKITKKGLSIQLDQRLYSVKGTDFKITDVTQLGFRIPCQFQLYTRLTNYLKQYKYHDPLLFVKNDEIWIALSFDTPELPVAVEECTGIDLGIKRLVATSDGKILKSPQDIKHRRKLRYLKRQLQSKNTKSSKRKLKIIRNKEQNYSKDLTHRIANWILKNSKSSIVFEDLSGIKTNTSKSNSDHKNDVQVKSMSKRFNNRFSQFAIARLQTIVSYKAAEFGKQILYVNPRNTSKNDHRGIKPGRRLGCRYYASDGVMLDADVNAAINIAYRSKLPVSPSNWLDGQATVNWPIACKSLPQGRALQARGFSP